MKILVINTGSSSIKYELFDMKKKLVLVSGLAERIGERQGVLTHTRHHTDGHTVEKKQKLVIQDHMEGMQIIVDQLLKKNNLGIRKSEISAVGHRVVHGGERFYSSTCINADVISSIRDNSPLAPLHNPANITGIEVAQSIFRDIPHIAVFDTAFHQTMPAESFLYGIPYELYRKSGIRKYGFHGTSHAQVTETAASYLETKNDDINLVTLHLGNGCSAAAVKNGRCIDTSMGMTPLSGLMMGTRCGDIDPGILIYLSGHLQLSMTEIEVLLNKHSGLKGICGTNDMREIADNARRGDNACETALKIYTTRIKKYIGAYTALLGNTDAVVFTGGVGENSPVVRKLSCQGLEKMGINLDPGKNQEPFIGVTEINTSQSSVKILVIPSHEGLRIAEETLKITKGDMKNAG